MMKLPGVIVAVMLMTTAFHFSAAIHKEVLSLGESVGACRALITIYNHFGSIYGNLPESLTSQPAISQVN